MSRPVDAPEKDTQTDEAAKVVESARQAQGASSDAYFQLRPRPRRVTQVRRGVVIALTATAALIGAGLMGFAMRGRHLPVVAQTSQDGTSNAIAPPEGLKALADDYSAPAPPLLGPALANPFAKPPESASMDRGGPVLKAQASPGRQNDNGDQSKDRALGAPLLVGRVQTSEPASQPASAVSQARPDEVSLTPRQLAGATLGDEPRFALAAGTVISANLVTGLNSDLPGVVLAQVAFDVFDTQSRRRRLVPRGARLIGAYQSAVSTGQSRVQLTFSKLVMPNGEEVSLDNLIATDTQGFSGLQDRTDRHGARVLSDAAVASLMGVGGQIEGRREGGQIARAIRQSTAQAAEDEAQMLMRRNLDLKPTLTVRPGWPFRLILPAALALPEQP